MTIYSDDGRYFEGILQLRPFNEEVYEWIKLQIDKDDSQFIVKEVEVRGGADIYFTSQRKLRALAAQLKRKFHGEVKITKSLFGRDKLKSKDVYRMTVLFKLK